MKCSSTFLVLILVVSLGSSAHGKKKASIELTKDATSGKADQYTQFLAANYQYSKGNAQKAMQSFQALLAKKHSPFVYDSFIQLLSDTGQFELIKKLYDAKGKEFKEAVLKVLKDIPDDVEIVTYTDEHAGWLPATGINTTPMNKQYANSLEVFFTVDF